MSKQQKFTLSKEQKNLILEKINPNNFDLKLNEMDLITPVENQINNICNNSCSEDEISLLRELSKHKIIPEEDIPNGLDILTSSSDNSICASIHFYLNNHVIGRLNNIAQKNEELRKAAGPNFTRPAFGSQQFDNPNIAGAGWRQTFPSDCNCNTDINSYDELALNTEINNQFNNNNNNNDANDYRLSKCFKKKIVKEDDKIIHKCNTINEWMNQQTEIINNIPNINYNLNNYYFLNNKLNNKFNNNCNFENKILQKKAYLYTNNNLGQAKSMLNLPKHKQWVNVAFGKKVNGQPAKMYGIQNNQVVKPNQYPNTTNVVNNRIILTCRKELKVL